MASIIQIQVFVIILIGCILHAGLFYIENVTNQAI
jgi:hypothetical protein